MSNTVLILGSAVDAVRARNFDGDAFKAIVAINNAWRIRNDWTHLLHAGDFPDERKPLPVQNKHSLSYEAYVPANNAFGGIVYAGGTMAFTTAYWALHTLKPDLMAFCGCDMIYDQKDGQSHFYGKGTPDPLRQDPTLQSLEAKANRLMILAAEQDCLCVNLSDLEKSRLTFPHVSMKELSVLQSDRHHHALLDLQRKFQRSSVTQAKKMEANSKQFVPTGDYWKQMDLLDPDLLDSIDQQWLAACSDIELTVLATAVSG